MSDLGNKSAKYGMQAFVESLDNKKKSSWNFSPTTGFEHQIILKDSQAQWLLYFMWM